MQQETFSAEDGTESFFLEITDENSAIFNLSNLSQDLPPSSNAAPPSSHVSNEEAVSDVNDQEATFPLSHPSRMDEEEEDEIEIAHEESFPPQQEEEEVTNFHLEYNEEEDQTTTVVPEPAEPGFDDNDEELSDEETDSQSESEENEAL